MIGKILAVKLFFCLCLLNQSTIAVNKGDCDGHPEEHSSLPAKLLGNRPSQIQTAVDKAFDENKDTDRWYYNGSDYYTLLDIDEDLMLKHLAFKNQKE